MSRRASLRCGLLAAALGCACLGSVGGAHAQEPAFPVVTPAAVFSQRPAIESHPPTTLRLAPPPAWHLAGAPFPTGTRFAARSDTLAPERRLLPPGLLRYRVPEVARPFAIPYLAVGTGLLVADPYVLRAFKLDSLYLRDDGTAPHQAHLLYRGFSRFGDPPLIAVLLVGLYALGGSQGRDAARVGGVAYANALSAIYVVKTLTGKERPHVSGGRLRYHGPSRHHASFPSAHAGGTAAVAHVFAHYYPEARLLWYGLSGAAGISRIGLARHWPSDVWFGWGMGVAAAEGALAERERLEAWRPW